MIFVWMSFVLLRRNRYRKSLFCLKFAMHILPAKPGNFSLKRVLVNGYLIVKWLCYIYRQFDCHFKLCYCYNLPKYCRYFLNSSISTRLGRWCHLVSYPVFSLSHSHSKYGLETQQICWFFCSPLCMQVTEPIESIAETVT